MTINKLTDNVQPLDIISTINEIIDSSGGGGSYTLPTASTTTLGGVKIDGSSITINNGVISSASSVVDSTLSSTSTNPVQNKVIYEAIGNIESILSSLNLGN